MIPILNIDETSHREKGKRFWISVFRAEDFGVFHIDKTRGSDVLERALRPYYRGSRLWQMIVHSSSEGEAENIAKPEK